MSRKRPSRHSEDQFALFLERIRDSLGDEDDAKFNEAVSSLIRQHQSQSLQGGGASNDDRAPADPLRREPLPERPAFEAIERAAMQTAGKRQALMALIGLLVFSWSNNESLLIYVLMLLLGTDEKAAAVVYSTLNTTRARLELVRRLTLLKVTDPAVRRSLDAIVDGFNDANRTRNEFLHAMYSVNERGEITHTQMMRFVEKGGRISFGDRQPIDEERINKLRQVQQELRTLNRTLWDFLPRLRAALVPADESPDGEADLRGK
jgi:hypothetical protein